MTRSYKARVSIRYTGPTLVTRGSAPLAPGVGYPLTQAERRPSDRSRLESRPMNNPSGNSVAREERPPVVPVNRPIAGAILTDIHFWIPVVVLAVGLGLLMYLS